MTARILGEQNKLTRADAAKEVDRRRGELRQYLADNLSGESVRLVIPQGASENAENIRAVVIAGGTNQVSLSCRTTGTSRVRAGSGARIFGLRAALQALVGRGHPSGAIVVGVFVSERAGVPVPPKRVLTLTSSETPYTTPLADKRGP